MTFKFRTTAVAAVLAVASLGALAAPVAINLDSLGSLAVAGAGPVAVGALQGFVFSDNAFAYHKSMLTSADISVPATTTGAFILNGNRTTGLPGGAAVTGLSISLGQTFVDAGQFFQSIDLSVFSRGAMAVTWFSGNTQVGTIPLSNPNTGAWGSWSKAAGWGEADKIDRVAFTSSGSAFMGLQSLSIGLTAATTGGGTVPEPGSYALVGFALLAVGALSRRRA